MGCGGSTDDVKPISVATEKVLEKQLTVKQEAIHKVFSKGAPLSETAQVIDNSQEKLTIKMNLQKRQGKPSKNVNLLVEDNTRVWDISS